ncbi:hypothetical protein AVEN_87592-1 [Araneus ventricosus]|uniref:Uncharacterized protein n=1 Tax=Araneus ventricosus TaxID=182803 RepID=A0A4Y2LT41_ARAVE|nr:hypothetical protein AVEN_87592-1 [Araneus ventricosus]
MGWLPTTYDLECRHGCRAKCSKNCQKNLTYHLDLIYLADSSCLPGRRCVSYDSFEGSFIEDFQDFARESSPASWDGETIENFRHFSSDVVEVRQSV